MYKAGDFDAVSEDEGDEVVVRVLCSKRRKPSPRSVHQLCHGLARELGIGACSITQVLKKTPSDSRWRLLSFTVPEHLTEHQTVTKTCAFVASFAPTVEPCKRPRATPKDRKRPTNRRKPIERTRRLAHAS